MVLMEFSILLMLLEWEITQVIYFQFFFSLQDTVRDAYKRNIYTFAKLNGLKAENTSL